MDPRFFPILGFHGFCIEFCRSCFPVALKTSVGADASKKKIPSLCIGLTKPVNSGVPREFLRKIAKNLFWGLIWVRSPADGDGGAVDQLEGCARLTSCLND
jgi:hypothetical protein